MLSLPATNSFEDLETISRNLLSLLLDPSLFEVRQELHRDKGIDLIVELKQDNSYTNFRFAVQLKSTALAKVNKDQSVSYPVDVANINYLLNYGMPAYYVLYDHATGVFYIERAHQVFQALSRKYASEKFPKQFKVRFLKKIGSEVIKEIYQETLENGLLLRRLHVHLNLLSASTKPVVGIVIDDEQDVYSVEYNMEFINQFGLYLLNQADFTRIIEIEQRTHPRTTASPIFNLVCGVAYLQQASLLKAVEFLKAAHAESSAFDPPIRSMLTYSFLQAKYMLGIIQEADFKNGMSELLQTEQLGSFLELERAYMAFIEGKEADAARIKTLQEKISNLIAAEPDNHNLRARAYAIILEIEGKQLIHNLPHNFASICGRTSDILATSIYKEWERLDKLHTERLRSLVKYCMDIKDFLAASNIMSANSEWVYKKVFILYVLKNWDPQSFSVKGMLSDDELDLLIEEADRTEKIVKGYEMLGHRENMVCALRLKYELLTLVGQPSDAEKTAKRIEALIETYDLNALRPKYYSLIDGDTEFRRFIHSFTKYMKGLYALLKNCGLADDIQQTVPLDIIEEIEAMRNSRKWVVGDFYNLEFPVL